MSDRMLAGCLELHDLADVEGYCRALLARYPLPNLTAHDREELLAYVISEVWIASQTYDRRRGTFANLAAVHTRNRITDWLRARHGRNGDRPRAIPSEPHVLERGVPVGSPIAREPGDGSGDSAPSLARILHGGDSRGARRD